MLREVCRTQNDLPTPSSSPGSVGMETCLVNLLEPDNTAIVCINGALGSRMAEIVRRCGATAITVDHAWGDPVDVDHVEAADKVLAQKMP